MSRTKLTTIFLVIFLYTGILYADKYQFKLKSGNNTYKAKYSTVQVLDARGNTIHCGSTDRYGRITIRNISNGTYKCKVFYNKIWRKAELTFDGSSNLKVVYVR